MDKSVEVTSLIQPVLDLLKVSGDEISVVLENGLRNYLSSQITKYYYVNTFIHRYEKVKLEDVYFKLSAKYLKLQTNFSDLDSVLNNYRYISIVGDAGSGKTMLSKYIFIKLIKLGKYVPIYITLRDFNRQDQPFKEFMFKRIITDSIVPTERILKRHLVKGGYVFILDGFDEIALAKKQDAISDIEQFIDNFRDNYYIITSRPGGGSERLPRFNDFKMVDLEPTEVPLFIDKMVFSFERRAAIQDLIGHPRKNDLYQYLKRPLLLSMYILAIESHPEVPEKLSSFYWNVFDTLYARHDGITKNGFPRPKASGLFREDFVEILELFSYTTHFEQEFRFTYELLEKRLLPIRDVIKKDFSIENLIYDLNTSISLLIQDGLEYEFPHRSMQEYFCAKFISGLETPDKIQFYKQYREHYDVILPSGIQNFWKLLRELDFAAFAEYYIIPELSAFLDIMQNLEGEEKIHQFYMRINYAASINKKYDPANDNIQDNSYTCIFGTLSTKYNSLIDFIGLDPMVPGPKSEEEIEELIKHTSESFSVYRNSGLVYCMHNYIEAGAKDYILSTNIPSEIDNLLIEISSELKKIQNLISTNSKKMTSFINLKK